MCIYIYSEHQFASRKRNGEVKTSRIFACTHILLHVHVCMYVCIFINPERQFASRKRNGEVKTSKIYACTHIYLQVHIYIYVYMYIYVYLSIQNANSFHASRTARRRHSKYTWPRLKFSKVISLLNLLHTIAIKMIWENMFQQRA